MTRLRHTGGQLHCPHCQEKVESRVLAKGYGQVMYQGVLAKRRKVICRKTVNGEEGCGHEWFTLEVPEAVLGIDSNSLPQRKRRTKRG